MTEKDWEARQRDDETTGQRDCETAKNPGILRRSQAFSVVRGSLASEWCSSTADKEIGLDG